jgi:hypothetical protein
VAKHRYPLIRKEDYAAMKALMGNDLPATHEQWEEKLRKWRDRDKLEDKSWSGETLVEINREAFAAYCGKETPTCSVLRRFVGSLNLKSDDPD